MYDIILLSTITLKALVHLISYETFASADLRRGTIVRAETFPKARKPAYKVWVDFGSELGILQTSAQITVHYQPDTLIGKSYGLRQFGRKKHRRICLTVSSCWLFRCKRRYYTCYDGSFGRGWSKTTLMPSSCCASSHFSCTAQPLA